MTPTTAEPRRADGEDARALADLERDANLVALRHVFDPARHAYPHAVVHRRWQQLLTSADVAVEVVDGRAGLDALLAHDAQRVRHLATRPEQWGQGLAGMLLERAVARIRAGGARPVLWCLVENHVARGVYERRGWTPTGAERETEFAPHPRAMEYALEGPS